MEEHWECGYGGVQQAQAIQADEESKEAAIRAANSEKESACSVAAGHEAQLRKKILRGGYGARRCQRTENDPSKNSDLNFFREQSLRVHPESAQACTS